MIIDHHDHHQGEPDVPSKVCSQAKTDGQATSSVDPPRHTYHGRCQQCSTIMFSTTIICKGHLSLHVDHIGPSKYCGR